MGINFSNLADGERYDSNGELLPSQLATLSPNNLAKLNSLGLVSTDRNQKFWPNWTLAKFYYWQQNFPAHQVVHIRHTYTPGTGQMQPPGELFDLQYKPSNPGPHDYASNVKKFIDAGCLTKWQRWKFENVKNLAVVVFVDYILTSANTWKTPIADFQLIVDPANPSDPKNPFTPSFCWNGPIDKLSDGRLSARARNFVPSKELRIYFWF